MLPSLTRGTRKMALFCGQKIFVHNRPQAMCGQAGQMEDTAMFEEVRIRERKSVKYGKTYEYRFEIAPIDGERKWLSKGGFLSEEEAKEAGIEAWKDNAAYHYSHPRTTAFAGVRFP